MLTSREARDFDAEKMQSSLVEQEMSALREQVAAIWTRRADRYSELRTRASGRTQKVEMSHIGG